MKNNEWKKICAACAEGTPPERCAYYGDPNGCNAPTLGKHPEGDLAERLQDELEKAERRIAELERVPGNSAAMRAALELLMLMPQWCCAGTDDEISCSENSCIYRYDEKRNCPWRAIRAVMRSEGIVDPLCKFIEHGKSVLDMADELRDKALAALSAPARNCDRFATAEEARRAFESAHSHGIVHNLYTAAFGWLFAPAEGGSHA